MPIISCSLLLVIISFNATHTGYVNDRFQLKSSQVGNYQQVKFLGQNLFKRRQVLLVLQRQLLNYYVLFLLVA